MPKIHRWVMNYSSGTAELDETKQGKNNLQRNLNACVSTVELSGFLPLISTMLSNFDFNFVRKKPKI